MGGAMEALVKLTKRSLKAIVKDRLFTEDALATFLTEVESVLNSRPLTPVSDDLEDFEALTPNHFILGRPSPNLPLGVYTEKDINLRCKWKSVQAATSMFWTRWLKEYLPLLTERQKWTKEERNLKVGDLVIIQQKGLKRCNWPLGRVIEVYPGKDNVVRSVKVKNSSGVLVRPSASLCLLEESK